MKRLSFLTGAALLVAMFVHNDALAANQANSTPARTAVHVSGTGGAATAVNYRRNPRAYRYNHGPRARAYYAAPRHRGYYNYRRPYYRGPAGVVRVYPRGVAAGPVRVWW